MPPAASLERTDAVMRKAEAVLGANPAVESYVNLTGFSLLTPEVNPLSGDARMRFTVSATDNLSGLHKIRIDVLGPSGQYIEINGDLATSGLTDTTVQLDSAHLNTQIQTGTWQVAIIEIFDHAGNSQLLRTSDLTAMGFATQIQVIH